MSRVMELEQQIKKLLEEKSKVYSEERKIALSDIKDKIALFEITAKELGFKAVDGRKSERIAKITSKNAVKKIAKKAARKSPKASGVYFDLGGKKVRAGRGRPPKEVTAFAVANGVTADSLKRNADGTPYRKQSDNSIAVAKAVK